MLPSPAVLAAGSAAASLGSTCRCQWEFISLEWADKFCSIFFICPLITIVLSRRAALSAAVRLCQRDPARGGTQLWAAGPPVKAGLTVPRQTVSEA